MPASTSPRAEAAAGRSTLLRPAVFLDRDGTIIHDRHYLGEPAGVELMPGAADAIARLNRAGLPVVIITNQSGIGRGYFSEAEFQAVQHRLLELLAAEGAQVDAAYHCPHAPDHAPPCACRKPRPGLFRQAADDLRLDLARSFYVGDRMRDVEPALDVGGTAILLGESARGGVRSVATLAEAADLILSASGRGD